MNILLSRLYTFFYLLKAGTTVFIITLIINFAFSNAAYSQNLYSVQYTQKDFEKNKIYDQAYNFLKYKNRLISNKQDTLQIPYFVDDRNYKGLINYGVVFRSRDYRNFIFTEGFYMHFLKVDFEKAIFNPKDSIIEIEGFISGGWGDSAKIELRENGIENNIDVYLGEKTDTTKNCYYSRVVNPDLIEVKVNNREIDENTILDTFPAFYFKKPSHYRTLPKGRRPFKIKGKVSTNTLLAFGGKNCYSEIFDLGTMVHYPKKNKRKKVKQRETLGYKAIIVNNKLLSDIEKEKAKVEEINYYTYTEKAEDYILRRQYAKAKEQYIALNKEYPVLFARDIHNAIRCALFSRDYENTFYWGEELAKKGVKIDYFKASIFCTLKKNKQWKSFSARYDSIYKEYQNSRNYKLKGEIEKLVQEDQADYGLDNRKEPKILYERTERVTDKLIALLKKEGYPSEEQIGVYTENDTILITAPDYHVLIRHAIQQNPTNLAILNDLLGKSINNLEYDSKRSPNNVFHYNSCFHIYKGNLYSSKSCGSNYLMVKKMKFIFNNPYSFFIYTDNFIVTEYNPESPEEYDKYYEENFDFVLKLTDNWDYFENTTFKKIGK